MFNRFVNKIAAENSEKPEAPKLDLDGYRKLAAFIKSNKLDMKTITGKIDISNIVASTLAGTDASFDVYFPGGIYTSAVFTQYLSFSGTPTDVKIRQPFSKIIYHIPQNDGNDKTYTFDRQAIGEIQVFMAKSDSFKYVMRESGMWQTSAGAVTSLEQNIFLPSPGFLLESSGEEILPEMLLPIRNAGSAYIQFVFNTNTDDWVEFTGGTTPAVTWSRTPEFRVSKLSSARSKRAIFGWLNNKILPAWNNRAATIADFTPSGTSYDTELASSAIPSQVNYALGTIQVFADSDATKMTPLNIKSFSEIGLYKDATNVLSGTSTAIRTKTLAVFDTLPYDGQQSTASMQVISVGDANPFNISNVKDIIPFGNATDYQFKIPTISSGVTAAKHNVKCLIYEIIPIRY